MEKQVENLILESIEKLRKDVTEIKTDTAVIKNDLAQQKTDALTKIEQLKKDSFPGGDTAGHRVYHEGEMEKRKNTVNIQREVTAHIIKGVFWAVLVGAFWAIAASVKEWMNK